ncbi:MAG: 5-(carboxyamino)imidazole ribonucleotide mutase [Planctomycetota bacterium]
MARKKAKIAIVMGSTSDAEAMAEAEKALGAFRIACEVYVMSAHRTPEAVAEFAKNAARKGYSAIIAGAGGAAHLAGVVAAHTTLPVIGVPMASGLLGVDSLLSTAQMPRGVPVATMAVGGAGAYNAGVLAAQIVGVGDARMRGKLAAFKKRQAREVTRKAREFLRKRAKA